MGILDRLKNSKAKKTSGEEKSYSSKTFILCAEEDYIRIMNVICDGFGVSCNGEGHTFSISSQDIKIEVTVFTKAMGQDEESLIKNQVDRVYGHFYEVNTENTDIKTNLLYDISRTNGMVFINYSFIEDGTFDKKSMIEGKFASILNEIQGIMLIMGEEEDGFYCQGDEDRGRAMELILSDKGNSSILKYIPEQTFTMTSENSDLNDEQIKRRLKSRKILEENFIYVPVWYPCIESESESQCRTPEEIAERAIALMIVSLYSECRLGEKMDYQEAYDFVKDIIESFDAEEFLSPAEKEYLSNPESTEQEQVSFSWQYENLFVMEWALGLVDELDFPDHICDVPLTVRLLNDCSTIADILKKSNPKSKSELLDECDLIFCLDWSCVDTRIHRLPAPAGMDKGVVYERHKSLNWLVGYDDRADWDDVGTDT